MVSDGWFPFFKAAIPISLIQSMRVVLSLKIPWILGMEIFWGHIKTGDFCGGGSWKLVTNYIVSWSTSPYFAGVIELITFELAIFGVDQTQQQIYGTFGTMQIYGTNLEDFPKFVGLMGFKHPIPNGHRIVGDPPFFKGTYLDPWG